MLRHARAVVCLGILASVRRTVSNTKSLQTEPGISLAKANRPRRFKKRAGLDDKVEETD